MNVNCTQNDKSAASPSQRSRRLLSRTCGAFGVRQDLLTSGVQTHFQLNQLTPSVSGYVSFTPDTIHSLAIVPGPEPEEVWIAHGVLDALDARISVSPSTAARRPLRLHLGPCPQKK